MPKSDCRPISCVDTPLCVCVCFSEQHAVDDLLRWAVKGVDIDGQVLDYLELAQVSLIHVFI